LSGNETTRVLVADADEGTRSLVRITLDGDSYDVTEADETDEAIRLIATRRPHLVLLDATLPGPGGVPLTRSLKSQPETRDALVVLMFSKSDPVDEEQARAAGVDEFLAKPFNAFALLKKVDGVIADSTGTAADEG